MHAHAHTHTHSLSLSFTHSLSYTLSSFSHISRFFFAMGPTVVSIAILVSSVLPGDSSDKSILPNLVVGLTCIASKCVCVCYN
jgi:hypothetical protein